MTIEDRICRYSITQHQVDNAVELLTTSLRHIPSFSTQLRAEIRDTISTLKNLTKVQNLEVGD